MYKSGFHIVLLLMLYLQATLNAQDLALKSISIPHENSNNDSVLLIEKKAAYYFHKLLNEYRRSNQADSIGWNETLWLTCKNHNIWMRYHNELSHTQKQGTAFFSGKSPGERYLYTTQNKGKCSWSGENALYNFSAHGKTITEIAKNIAQACIDQWKKSPGHNKNMLSGKHAVHGVSFVIDNSRVWGTDLFAYNTGDKEKETIELSDVQKEFKHLENISYKETNKNSDEVKKVTTRYLKSEIEKALIADLNTNSSNAFKPHKHLNKSAQKHAEYMAGIKKLTLTEEKSKRRFYAKSSRARLLKASSGLSILVFGNKNLVEQIALSEADENNLNPKIILSDLKKSLSQQNFKENSSGSAGIGVSIKKQNGKIMIYVSRTLITR